MEQRRLKNDTEGVVALKHHDVELARMDAPPEVPALPFTSLGVADSAVSDAFQGVEEPSMDVVPPQSSRTPRLVFTHPASGKSTVRRSIHVDVASAPRSAGAGAGLHIMTDGGLPSEVVGNPLSPSNALSQVAFLHSGYSPTSARLPGHVWDEPNSARVTAIAVPKRASVGNVTVSMRPTSAAATISSAPVSKADDEV
jgi:hypothetical protein